MRVLPHVLLDMIKLIAFDLDGVLVNGYGSWWQVHQFLGTYDVSRKHAQDYFDGKITFDEWATKDSKLWYGVKKEKIREALYQTEYMPGIEKTLNELKKKYTLVIISGGLQILADRIKEEFDMDYAIANRLLFKDERVCGVDQIVDFQGKGKILEKIADDYDVTTQECAAIGDYLNDIPMFKVAGFSIAFNPKNEEMLKYTKEAVYEKNLEKILPYF